MYGADKLLASDLDGTVIPPGKIAGDGGISLLRGALERSRDVALAYVTGRSLALAMDGIARHGLPRPDILVCDVGTSVFIADDGAYEPDPGYRELMLEALGGAHPSAARRALSELEHLELQEEHKQAEFKLSYYLPPGPGMDELAALSRERLEGVGRFNVVHSVDPVDQRGLLDVLPGSVAKDVAVRYLHDRSGVAEDDLAYAGDSGNDRAALLSGYNVIVVGNAEEDLKRAIASESAEMAIADRVYFSEAFYAAGVMEGSRHFGVL